MRIANIIEEGKLGGPQVRMIRVANALDGYVETLIVMPQSNSEPFQRMCSNLGVTYLELPLTRITKEWRAALAYVLFSPWEVLQLKRVLCEQKIDLVHASGGSWQYKAVIAARLARVPSVWHLNDTSMPSWVRCLFNIVQPLASGFIFASHRSRDYYGKQLSGRINAIVPSTVDTEMFNPTQHCPGDERILEKLGSAPVIGTVANVNRIKGLELLIQSFALARKRVPSLFLVIVGPIHDNQVAYHKELSELAESLGVAKQIVWSGARSDVRPLLLRMDVYVCSSLAESSPVSVWEAMAMACPIVSTDVGDVSRHVINGESGYVVPVGDDVAMAGSIEDLIKDSKKRKRMGIAARQAAKYFSPSAIARKTMDVYQQVIDSSTVSAVSKKEK